MLQRGQVQLQGIAFPFSIREQGTSVELLSLKSRDYAKWIAENRLEGDKQWGIISEAKTKEERLLLSLTFKRVIRTRYKFQNGRIEKVEEESTEPELGEFHFRDDDLLELFSCGAKLRTSILKSISEAFGKEELSGLSLTKDAMTSLMEEAIEVNSVSFTGLGNPFFTDVTLSGPDPKGSKTHKELLQNGEIKSFRGKFQTSTDDASIAPLMVTISSNCKVRFFGGQNPVAQSDIEEFTKKVASLATSARDEMA